MRILILALLSVNSLVLGQTTNHVFKAAKATTGTGLHKEKVWWISWDLNNDGKNADILTKGVSGTFTSPSGYKYHITLSDAKVYNGTTLTTDNIKSDVTTSWDGNSFRFGYSGFSIPDIFAINNGGNARKANFKLKIERENPITGVKGKPKGIVIAGSESLATSEYYILTSEDANSKVKIIDKYIHNNNWANFSLCATTSNSGKTIRANGGGDYKGDVMLYAENTANVSIELKGNGQQHISLGFIEELDYNDKPISSIPTTNYGEAFHLMETSISNTTTADGNICLTTNNNETDLNNGLLTPFTAPKFMMLGNEIGADSGATSTDDDDSIPTEFDKLNQYFILDYNNQTDLPGYINMWVDANRNGVYESSEKALFPINPETKSNILVNLKKYYNLIAGNDYHIRLRISSAENLGPTGFAPDGEVEDYVFEIAEKPNDIAGTVFLDKDGGVPNGVPMANIEVRLTKEGDASFAQSFFTNEDGEYLFYNLYDGKYTIQIIKPSDKEHISSTDNTPLDGQTTVAIIKDAEQNFVNIDFGLYSNVCFRPAATLTDGLPTEHGISALNRIESNLDGWPKNINGAWTALESKTKGFVINRVAADSEADGGQVPSIKNPVQGMIIYDTTNNCLKIFNGTSWKCFNQLACPQN